MRLFCSLTMISLFILSIFCFSGSALSEPKEEASEFESDDREIIAMMELLEIMELLETMELLVVIEEIEGDRL